MLFISDISAWFAHVPKVGFAHPTFSLRDINVTLGLLPSRGIVMWRGSVNC